ncbi:MAG: class II fructose-bisphosphate aldolase, partial [Anaerolineae bacterium]|nr:class II fructose-bisphosphate aldolase [Thermoflexales bacterium]MDW8408924.1 class II fructose-bisphosphate aldolase [Anaerolineae bacterium]
FQLLADRYKKDTDAELGALRRLIDACLQAGFYNFDLDTSTIVDWTKSTPDEQQRHNCELSALLTDYIRVRQPYNVVVAVGGEIGSGGRRNSDIHELRAYLNGVSQMMRHKPGLCKVAVMAGTTRGGIVAPNGALLAPEVDFRLLRELSEVARKEYGLGGVSQHGTSTAPDEMFVEFARSGAVEVKLATQLQNTVLDSLPESLREEMRTWILKTLDNERKPGLSEAQFLHRARRRAIGPFKEQMWRLSEADRGHIRALLEHRFVDLFTWLGVTDTRTMVSTFVSQPQIHKTPQDFSDQPPLITPEQE